MVHTYVFEEIRIYWTYSLHTRVQTLYKYLLQTLQIYRFYEFYTSNGLCSYSPISKYVPIFIFKIRIYFLFTLTTLQTNTEVFLRFNAFMNSSLLWIWSNKCPFLCECCIIISLQLPMLSIKKFIKGYYQLVRCGSIKDQDGFQLEFVSISQVINHMTCYKFESQCSRIRIVSILILHGFWGHF